MREGGRFGQSGLWESEVALRARSKGTLPMEEVDRELNTLWAGVLPSLRERGLS